VVSLICGGVGAATESRLDAGGDILCCDEIWDGTSFPRSFSDAISALIVIVIIGSGEAVAMIVNLSMIDGLARPYD